MSTEENPPRRSTGSGLQMTGGGRPIDQFDLKAPGRHVVDDLRRRRDASRRLLVLDCDYADPLDELAARGDAEPDWSRYDCIRQWIADPDTVVRLSCAQGCRYVCARVVA